MSTGKVTSHADKRAVEREVFEHLLLVVVAIVDYHRGLVFA